MNTFKTGDTIRVTANEKAHYHTPNIEGEHGFIEEVDTEHSRAQLVLLHPDGRALGYGSHPLELLAPETDAKWVSAKRAYDDEQDRLQREFEARTADWNRFTAEVGEEFGVDAETVKRFYRRCREWRGFR